MTKVVKLLGQLSLLNVVILLLQVCLRHHGNKKISKQSSMLM